MKSPTTIQTFLQQTPQSNVGIKYSINLNQSNFKETIDYLVDNYNFDEIVETGTYNGLGSTSVFAKTKKYVFSIECNLNNYLSATKNLSPYQNVCVIHGLTLNRNKLIYFLLNQDFTDDTTYDSDYPKTFYMREVSQSVVVEEALSLFCNNERKQLVFLDSAGGVGYAEFLEFISYKEIENKLLVLDDIDHIKHKRSVEYLEKNGYVVNKSNDNRFAWCDLSKGKLKREKNESENIISK
jgi:hypothetical protein